MRITAYNHRAPGSRLTGEYSKRLVAFLPGAMRGMSPNGSNFRAPVNHLVPDTTTDGDVGSVALCGRKPGRFAYGWHPVEDEPVTCDRCLKELSQQ